MKELLNEWRNFLLEAEAEYSGILKVSLTPEAVKKVEELQNQIIRKNRDAVKLAEDALHVTAVHQSFMKPFKFIQEVRREGSKVTWPTSRETLTGSVMVVIITAFAAVFFLIIDQIFSFGLDKLIGVVV